MNKLEQAARQILEAIEAIGFVSDYWDEKVTALREALAEQAEQEPSCNQHPDAPHGFARNASHNAGRYVCECEGWEPEQEPLLKHRTGDCLMCGHCSVTGEPLYAAPVRTKDLTDDEIAAALKLDLDLVTEVEFRDARAVIAADREKNR